MLPGPARPVPADVVHESGRTRVTRLLLPGGTVIRKEPLGPDADRRARHEATMLGRLRGAPGVAQLAGVPQYAGSVMLEDAGESSLAGIAGPLPAGQVVRLGLGLARAVAEMHRRGVTHRDIAPGNIVLSGDGAPCLVDFALAAPVAEVRPEFSHHSGIAGTLAYLAPEATGRTGRPADQRADLYALGAVLYELATGGPPFGSGDPPRLVYDHLARVPVPPAEANQAVPTPLSAIIMHLLEKEPDNRYQTADGLVHDLERLREAGAHPAVAAFRAGERDFPVRLLPPSRLAGRDEEAAALRAAFAGVAAGECRGVLVAGAPGVGKTALVDQLRPAVAGGNGWFVAGKFDQYRRDLEFDAGYQAFRALGRLLLAEPDDELARVRMGILAAAGANAGLLTATVPEFAVLLGVPPDAGDPLTAQARVQRAAAAALRAVASRERPVVLFLDDLQWAGRTPLGLVDLVLSEEPIEGLLLVGAYRDGELDGTHRMAAPLARWRGRPGVRHVRLTSLPAAETVIMVAEMLRVTVAAVAGVAGAIAQHARGNPYETVELLNALRRDGLLTATAAGWQWDEAAVRAHLDRSEMTGLLAARAGALQEESRRVAEAMACLGGRAELSLLQAATGEPAGVVDQALASALDEGLLVAEPGERPAVRFRHDRIREAILDGLGPSQRQALQLAMARRLAAVPELFVVAAEQYLPAIGAVTDGAERRRVTDLLRRAAGQAALTGDYALLNGLLTAALAVVEPGEYATLAELHTGRHAALYCLGRLEEADEVYRALESLCPAVLDRADATAVQVRSVTYRTRYPEAVGLGLQALRELGIAVPAADLIAAELDQRFGYLYQWLDNTEAADDLARPDLTDPTLIAACGLINPTSAAAYLAGDPATTAWLGLEALRICLKHGLAPAQIVPAAFTAFGAAVRGDYAAGYRVARRILALSEARGYEPGTSNARAFFALFSCWAEPLENGVHAGQQARKGLIAGGDPANAGYTYYASVPGLLDCAPALDRYLAEAEAASAFVRRTGSEQEGQVLDTYRWLAGALLGDSPVAADEAVSADLYAGNPLAQFVAHLNHANAAAIFGDQAGLERHTAAFMPLIPMLPGFYLTAVAYLLRGLALAGQARGAHAGQRGDLLAELDEVTRWLAARAADAPDNFLHLLRLVEAERAWAAGDFRAAALAFDAARSEAARRERPWHRALIAEHAARFYLSRGVEQVGRDLLARARQGYLSWGATAKVRQLDWAYPVLRAPAGAAPGDDAPFDDRPRDRAAVATGTIDLLAIVSASQALSSETSVGQLGIRVAEVLSAMTGATDVNLLLWSEDRHGWLLPAPNANGGPFPASDPGQERAAPMSVLRYVLRTREPLVVADAVRDDRFVSDPYFADVACCAVLAVPVLSRGMLRAVLLLENRLLGGAFTGQRLDAVKLIAGQLAVSLDNAQLYAEFRQVADEQAALRRVATLVAQATPPEDVFAAVAEEAGRLLDVDSTILSRYDQQESVTLVGAWTKTGAVPPTPLGSQLPTGGHNVTTQVFQSGQAARTDYTSVSGVIGGVTRDWGLRSSVGVPIRVEGRLWGVMIAASAREELLPADTEKQLFGFAELVATAIASTQARTELRGVAEEQAALRRVATLVARAAPPEDVFAAVAAEAGRLLGADAALAIRYHPQDSVTVVGAWTSSGAASPLPVGRQLPLGGHNATTQVFRTGQPARVEYADMSGLIGEAAAQGGWRRASVGVPIRVEDQLWGVMIAARTSEELLPADTESRLARFTELAATAIANAQARAEVSASRARILAAADETRRRIQRDLHDGVQQRMVIQALMLSGIRDRVPADVRADVDELRDELAAARQELRDLSQGVHPAILVEAGLGAAIRALARRSPLPVRVQLQAVDRLPGSADITAYYVAAEAFANAAKHASASAVDILIEEADGTLTVQVRDDGVGGADTSRGSGLTGLRDRVEAVGGSMTLDSPVGAGTVLTVLLPVPADGR